MKTASKKAKVKGVTELTMEKHRFEGFNVRMQVKGYSARKYVSSSVASIGKGSATARRSKAKALALEDRQRLEDILANSKSWRNDGLTKAAAKALTDLGFKVTAPAQQ